MSYMRLPALSTIWQNTPGGFKSFPQRATNQSSLFLVWQYLGKEKEDWALLHHCCWWWTPFSWTLCMGSPAKTRWSCGLAANTRELLSSEGFSPNAWKTRHQGMKDTATLNEGGNHLSLLYNLNWVPAMELDFWSHLPVICSQSVRDLLQNWEQILGHFRKIDQCWNITSSLFGYSCWTQHVWCPAYDKVISSCISHGNTEDIGMEAETSLFLQYSNSEGIFSTTAALSPCLPLRKV